MIVNGSVNINSMFVERAESGDITLYGAHYGQKNGLVVVVRSTKNMMWAIPQELYGKEYTKERILKKLNEHPNHNFIVKISVPVTMNIDTNKVVFID